MSLGKSTSTSATKLNQISVQSSTLGKPIALGWGRGRLSCNLIWYNGFKATSHTTKSGGGKGMGGSSNTTYTYTASVIMALCEGAIGSVSTVYRDTSTFSSLAAAGLSLANGSTTQPVWGYLTSKFPSEALAYSGIAYVYAQDYALSDSATLPNHSFEVNFAIQGPSGVPDANPKDIISDFLTSTAHGVPGWGSGLLGDLSDFSSYCLANNLLLSPVLDSQQRASNTIEEWLTATNSAPFWSEGVLKIRPYGDTAATGNGVTWTPDLSPEYDLTENDLQADPDGAVKLDIKDQSDAYNVVQFEFFDRANQYNTAIATAQDLSNIVEFGQRKQDPVTVHAICDASIAQKAVQLYLQRVLYVRETYTFRLPWNFVLLEPMDLVTLTTSADELQLNRQLVRIIEIEEDEDGLLTFTAEGVDAGVAGAAQYASHSGDGYIGNTDVAPGSVSSPALFVPPVGLTGFDPEVWCAVASTSATWGGCEVWVSADGTNYSRAGRIDGPARYGVLSAALPSHADPDNANTLSVNLATSLGALDGGTAAEMNAAATLAIVDGELISYQNATLTGAYAYNLSPLRRGLNGTAPAAHASGATFVRLDDAIFKLNYASLNVGETIWVKFPSFNVWGKAIQDLSTVTAYSITVPSADTRYSAALADITAISSDSILAHGSEKQQAYIDYQALLNDYNALSAQYAAKGNPSSVTTAASDATAAMTALTNYLAGLSPSWTNTAVDTPIVAATWTATWGAAYNKVATFRAALTGRDAVNGYNRLRDTDFKQPGTTWTMQPGPGVTLTSGPATVQFSGSQCLRVEFSSAGGTGRYFAFSGPAAACSGNESLAVQLIMESSDIVALQQLYVRFFDASGSQIAAPLIDQASGFARTMLKGFVTSPSNAASFYLLTVGNLSTAGASGSSYITHPMASSARVGQTDFPPYSPGVADGADGVPGAPGADGQTLYEWIAYADSPDGSVNFTTGTPGGRGYQGRAINKTSPSEGTNPADYQWAPYRGPASFGLVPSANAVVGSDYIARATGGGVWDASAYSSEAFVGGAFTSTSLSAASSGTMFGLNTDPTTDSNFTSIDFAFYTEGSIGRPLYVFENGTGTAVGNWSVGDVLTIAYDNKQVTYYQNGTILRQISAAAGLRLYFDSSLADFNSRISGIRFGPSGSAGADGINTATINIFQRGSSAPALPTAATTYDFSAKSLTGLNNGWSTTIPAGTAPLWQSAATAAGQGATDTIAASEWAGAVQIAANGANAASSAPVLLYNRTSTASAPAVPSTTVTYDFGTAIATGMNNGWVQSLPASGGAYRWQINATAVSTTGTDTIAPGEWSAPNIMAQDGDPGSPGTSTAQLTIYQRAASTPALPSVSATYDFAAKTLSGLSGGWSATIPAGTDPVYTAQALASSTGTTASIAPGDWSTPVKAIQNGQDSTTARASLSVTDDGVPITGSSEVTIATATMTLASGGKLKVSGGVFDAVGSNDNLPGGSTQISTAGMRLKVAGTTIASGALTITADGIVTADPVVGWAGQLLTYSASGSVTVSLTRQRSGPAASGGATYSINLLLEAVT